VAGGLRGVGDCADWSVGVLPLIGRLKVRHAYRIEGGVCEDCLASFYCCCCVVIQNEREVREREERVRRNEGPVGAAAQYQSVGPGAMMYAPGRS